VGKECLSESSVGLVGILSSSLLVSSLECSGSLSCLSDVRVKLGSESEVSQSVLLDGSNGRRSGLLGSEGRLDFSRVDDSGNIGVGEERSGCVVEFVQLSESISGPENESSDVSSGGELKEVEGFNVDEFNSGKISEGVDESAVLRVDNEGSSSGNVSAISDLSVSSSDVSGFLSLDDIIVCVEVLEESDGSGGFVDVGKRCSVDNQRNFSNSFDSVSSGQNKGGEGRSGKSGSDGVSSLVKRRLSVPSSEGLGGCKHSSSSAHVSESSLT